MALLTWQDFYSVFPRFVSAFLAFYLMLPFGNLWYLHCTCATHQSLREGYMQIWSSFICDSLISGIFLFSPSIFSHFGSSEFYSLTSQANKLWLLLQFCDWVLTHCFCIAWGLPSVENCTNVHFPTLICSAESFSQGWILSTLCPFLVTVQCLQKAVLYILSKVFNSFCGWVSLI